MIFKPYSRANPISSLVLIISPSSLMISQQSPHSSSPAIRIRSTVASVCPSRSSTPQGFASNGNMCPGLRKSSGRASGATHFMAVTERSMAEIPVLVDTWSIDSVKAVQWLSVFLATICGSPSFLVISRLIGMHIRPLPYVAIKFTFSVVAYFAAHIRSPSFSLSGESMTTIILPCLKSSAASGIVLNFIIL